jgi:uncharacterized OB-fold protein
MENGGGVAQHWRMSAERYKLVGHFCDKCGAKIFGRQFCGSCSSEAPPQSIELPVVAAEIINQLASEE